MSGSAEAPAASDPGVFLRCTGTTEVRQAPTAVRSLGLKTVQLSKLPDRHYSTGGAGEITGLLEETGIRASAVVTVYDGESYRDIQSIRETAGLLPMATMQRRVEYTKKIVDFAAALGVRIVTLHAGFIPADIADPYYKRIVEALGDIARYAKGKGVRISLETGQESAEELLAFIGRVKGADVGVNFDIANLVLHGKDDPPSALRKLLPKVTPIHLKDGNPPATRGRLGSETRIGEGTGGVKECLQILKDAGFKGPLVIENYVSRVHKTEPMEELARAKAAVEKLLGGLR